MGPNTTGGQTFYMGSFYAEFGELADPRKARVKRYRLETVLTLIVLAKVCGKDRPSGIAEWAQHRLEWWCDVLKLERKTMPHRSSYERILEVIHREELQHVVSRVLSGKRYFGKQVLLAIDGRVLRRTLNENLAGVYLLVSLLAWARHRADGSGNPRKGQELEAAPQMLKWIDLRDKGVMGDPRHTPRGFDPDPDPLLGQAYVPKDFEMAQCLNKDHGQCTLTVGS
jgi:DDE family transposase